MKRYNNKSKIFFMVIALSLIMSALVLSGCNNNANPDDGVGSYTITFVTNGGSQVSPITVKEGELISLPTEPTLTGSEFSCWCTDSELQKPLTSFNMGARDLTLYAKWLTIDQAYTISFDTSGGSVINGATYNKGEAITAPSNPERQGYAFMGWTLDGDRYEFGQIAERSLTLKADWLQGEWDFDKVGENTIIKMARNIGENVVVPNNYFGSAVVEIVANAFKNNINVKTITLSDTIKKVGSYAFGDCTALSSIDLGNIQSLGSFAFNNCTSIESANLPDSLSIVGESLFNNCLKLQEIKLNNNTNFPLSIFENCTNLKSIEVSQSNTKYLSSSGILYNKGASEIVAVPINISGTVTLPTTLTDISKGAFMGRTAITMIKVGANVKNIGSFAFYDCLKLKYIIFDGETPPLFEAKAFDQRLTEIKVKVPQSAKSAYQITLLAYNIAIS